MELVVEFVASAGSSIVAAEERLLLDCENGSEDEKRLKEDKVEPCVVLLFKGS